MAMTKDMVERLDVSTAFAARVSSKAPFHQVVFGLGNFGTGSIQGDPVASWEVCTKRQAFRWLRYSIVLEVITTEPLVIMEGCWVDCTKSIDARKALT